MSIHQASYLHKFTKAIEYAQNSFAVLRTGRASVSLLDSVTVEAYGGKMALREVAAISAPDSQLLVIKPWDKNLLGEIEKAVQVAGLNLNPIIDGEIIRIAVPPLTQERRQEMVKILHQKAEESRVMLRSIRSEIRKDIDKQLGAPGISEDDVKAEITELDEAVKEQMATLEEMVTTKERDLLSM